MTLLLNTYIFPHHIQAHTTVCGIGVLSWLTVNVLVLILFIVFHCVHQTDNNCVQSVMSVCADQDHMFQFITVVAHVRVVVSILLTVVPDRRYANHHRVSAHSAVNHIVMIVASSNFVLLLILRQLFALVLMYIYVASSNKYIPAHAIAIVDNTVHAVS
jgi:hypothetical protein